MSTWQSAKKLASRWNLAPRWKSGLQIFCVVPLSVPGQMCAVETGQMSSVETGQMSAVETGQMSAVETTQMSSAETRQIYNSETGQRPV